MLLIVTGVPLWLLVMEHVQQTGRIRLQVGHTVSLTQPHQHADHSPPAYSSTWLPMNPRYPWLRIYLIGDQRPRVYVARGEGGVLLIACTAQAAAGKATETLTPAFMAWYPLHRKPRAQGKRPNAPEVHILEGLAQLTRVPL